VWSSTPTSEDRIVACVRGIFRRRKWHIPRSGRPLKEPGIDRFARDFAHAAFVIERVFEHYGMIRRRAIERTRARLYEQSTKAAQRGDECVAWTIAAAWRFVAEKRARWI